VITPVTPDDDVVEDGLSEQRAPTKDRWPRDDRDVDSSEVAGRCVLLLVALLSRRCCHRSSLLNIGVVLCRAPWCVQVSPGQESGVRWLVHHNYKAGLQTLRFSNRALSTSLALSIGTAFQWCALPPT